MPPHRTRSLLRRMLVLGALALIVVLAPSCWVQLRHAHRIVALEAAPQAPVAIVFGAGLAARNEPSPVLAERLDTAIALYKAGRVEKLLLSGDNSDRYHDETQAMRVYALARGVDGEDLLVDPAGLSTFATCVRAAEVFEVRRALLVTQRFHLPRALYIANSVGLDADGVAADEAQLRLSVFIPREVLSRTLAWAMVLRHKAESAEEAGR